MEKFHKGETVVVKSNIYGLKAGEKVRIIESSGMPHGTEYCVYPPDGIPTWLSESQLERDAEPTKAEPTKKEPEYNEVKRVAKVGEYIKLIKPRYTFDKIGMILPIDAKDGNFVQTRGIHYPCDTYTNAPNANWGHIPEEYVVLEGYKPKQNEQEWERRKAKAGDTIKVIENNYGEVTPGTIWKVKSVDESGNLNIVHDGDNFVWGCTKGNYLVLVYGKHSYTDEEIAKAKKLVLDMINSIYAGSNEVVFFGNKGKKVYYAILITNGAKCHLEATHNSTVAHVGASAIGWSKCSDHDEPNEWIGKCVALSNALNKPIPDFIKW